MTVLSATLYVKLVPLDVSNCSVSHISWAVDAPRCAVRTRAAVSDAFYFDIPAQDVRARAKRRKRPEPREAVGMNQAKSSAVPRACLMVCYACDV